VWKPKDISLIALTSAQATAYTEDLYAATSEKTMPPSPLTNDSDFRACFDQYYPLVYKTALLLLDSAQEAEDAAQEIFLQVYRHRHTYNPERAALSTWIYRIAVNHCHSRRRKAAWRYWIRKRWIERVPLTHTPSPEVGLSDIAVRLALQQLTDPMRTVLVLRFYNDLTYEQIAEILDIPVGTAKSRLHLALKTLRTHLVTHFEDMQVIPLQETVP
jgi:RNA polymerase sigma-70 factor, ECF subfamily